VGASAPPSAPGELAGEDDIRLKDEWDTGRIGRYVSSQRSG